MLISTKLIKELKLEVRSMFKKSLRFFDKVKSSFSPVVDTENRNDWNASVVELTTDEIFHFTNKALSNYKYLTASFKMDNLNENDYLLRYLKSTHDALEILRIVILCRSKDIKSLFSWNMRIIEIIDELKTILTPYYPEVNRSFTRVEFSINELKFLLSAPSDGVEKMFIDVEKLEKIF